MIGGGYAGMAAAVTLAASGVPVTVYESAKQLGGRARGVLHNGTQLDNGQHILLGCYHHTLRLITQVGGDIEKDFLCMPLQLTLHNHFELKAPRLPTPLHLLVGLLSAQGITFAQRLQAARFMLAMRRMRFTLAADMTAASLLANHKQDVQLIRLLWEPLCIAALNTPLHKASAQVLLNVLRDSLNGSRADSDMLLPRLDFSALFPDRAAAYVQKKGGDVHTSCTVESIAPHADGVTLHTTQGAHTYRHVICAATPATAARLLRGVSQLDSIANQIEAISYQPIYTLYLQYPPTVRLPNSMLGLDRCFSQWLFDKGQIAGQHGLIAAVISAEGQHQELSQDELAQTVARELREQLGINEIPLWHQVIAEKRATFSCIPDLVRPTHTTPLPGLLLAGDYTTGDYPATLEGAVRSGLNCAQLILRTAGRS